MKKALIIILCSAFLLNGCFITRIFHKQDKYGCPSDGRNVGAEKLLSGDKVKKAKYRGGKKSYGE